jgi:hypothetical protein
MSVVLYIRPLFLCIFILYFIGDLIEEIKFKVEAYDSQFGIRWQSERTVHQHVAGKMQRHAEGPRGLREPSWEDRRSRDGQSLLGRQSKQVSCHLRQPWPTSQHRSRAVKSRQHGPQPANPSSSLSVDSNWYAMRWACLDLIQKLIKYSQ